MNAHNAYATTTQVLPRLKWTLFPVRTLAAKLMAARTRRKIAVSTTRSTTKAANREANPA